MLQPENPSQNFYVRDIEKVHPSGAQEIVDIAVVGYMDILHMAGIDTLSSQHDIQEQVWKFMRHFDADIDFFWSAHGKIRPFMLIGIADLWLNRGAAVKGNSARALYDLVKILMNQEHIANLPKTVSRRVIQAADRGRRLGYEFVSGNLYTPSQRASNWEEKRTFMEGYENVDLLKTEELQEMIDIANANSFLHPIRRDLGILEETERPFTVIVSVHDSPKLAKLFNGDIAFFNNGMLCLPSDFDYHLVEHEYIHSQSTAIKFGANGLLFVGLSEAWTEDQTQSPVYYEPQCRVLRPLLDNISGLRDDLRAFNRHATVAKLDRIYLRILGAIGLPAFIQLARMSPSNAAMTDSSSYYHGKYIFLAPHEVEQTIIKALRRSDNTGIVYRALSEPLPYMAIDSAMTKALATGYEGHDYPYKSDLHAEAELTRCLYLYKTASDNDKKAFLSKAVEIWSYHPDELYAYIFDMMRVLIQQTKEDQIEGALLIFQALEQTNKDVYQSVEAFRTGIPWWEMMYSDGFMNQVAVNKVLRNVAFNAYERDPNDYRLGVMALGYLSADLIAEDNPLPNREQLEDIISSAIQSIETKPIHELDPMKIAKFIRRIILEEVLDCFEEQYQKKLLMQARKLRQILDQIPIPDMDKRHIIREYYIPRIDLKLAEKE